MPAKEPVLMPTTHARADPRLDRGQPRRARASLVRCATRWPSSPTGARRCAITASEVDHRRRRRRIRRSAAGSPRRRAVPPALGGPARLRRVAAAGAAARRRRRAGPGRRARRSPGPTSDTNSGLGAEDLAAALDEALGASSGAWMCWTTQASAPSACALRR